MGIQTRRTRWLPRHGENQDQQKDAHTIVDERGRDREEIKRRADVICIFRNEASITRLIGGVLLRQNDEWQLQHRYMRLEAVSELLQPVADGDLLELLPKAA